MKEKKTTMKFRGRTQSKKAIGSLVLSVLCVLGFITLCVLSTMWDGEAPMFVGSIALLLAVLCMAAFGLAVNALKEKEVYYGMPIVSMLLSGAQFIVFLCLYMIGIL